MPGRPASTRRATTVWSTSPSDLGEPSPRMRRDIEFKSGGETVRGWLYTPERGNGPFPVVVMAGGWCYVKELVQPHVAQQFADTGLAAILFDYRNFGSSDGTRRQHIDPNAQTRGLPQRDLLRRDAGRGRLRQDRRLGAVLQRWSRAHPRRHRPAREMRLGADSRRRRISQHAARARDDRLPPFRTALAGRPAVPLRKRRGRIPASRDAPTRPRRSRPGPSPRPTRRSSI